MLHPLIHITYRGGLFYPTQEFVARLHTFRFVERVLPLVAKTKNLLEDFVNYLTPIVMQFKTFSCDLGHMPDSRHHEILVVDVIAKFVSPILKNYTKFLNDEIIQKAVEKLKAKRAAAYAAGASKNEATSSKTKAETRKLRTVNPF